MPGLPFICLPFPGNPSRSEWASHSWTQNWNARLHNCKFDCLKCALGAIFPKANLLIYELPTAGGKRQSVSESETALGFDWRCATVNEHPILCERISFYRRMSAYARARDSCMEIILDKLKCNTNLNGDVICYSTQQNHSWSYKYSTHMKNWRGSASA